MALDVLIAHIVDQSDIKNYWERPHPWTDKEILALRKYCSLAMTDLEISLKLQRSETAIKLKRKRLKITTARNTPGWISVNKARIRLGMNDTRPIIGWIQKGLLLGRLLPQGSTCWMINEVSLRRFVTRPKNGPYFDTQKVRDRHLRRLIHISQEIWGNEWLTTRQAADLVGEDIRKVNLYIKLGRLESVRTYNKDGRRNVNKHPRWSWNFVKRSQVLDVKWDYYPGEASKKCTEAGLEWIRAALRMGWSKSAIARSMKLNPATVCNWVSKYGLEES